MRFNKFIIIMVEVLASSAFLSLAAADKSYMGKMEKTADEYYNKGLNYYKQNEVTLAKIEWERALKIFSNHKNVILALSMLESERYKGDSDELYHETIKNIYEKGIKYYRLGESEKALAEWKKALDLNPGQRQIKKFYNEVYNKLRSKEQPNKETKESKNIETGQVKVITYPKSKKKEKNASAEVVKKMLSADNIKSKAEEYYKEGLKNYQKKNFEKAKFYWQEVLKLDPGHKKSINNLEKLKNELKGK